jgi:uncharacterized protein YecA (UPF0149 family)
MRTWTTETVDVRSDPTVAAEVAAFISDCRCPCGSGKKYKTCCGQ